MIWYLQQLLKLYACNVIPDILDRYLVIDSDTFFLKPTTFIENDVCLYNYGSEYHKPYFKHMLLLHKDFIKMVIDKAGSGASEYELYFNYMIKNHKDKIKIRPLKWKNTNDILKKIIIITIMFHGIGICVHTNKLIQ